MNIIVSQPLGDLKPYIVLGLVAAASFWWLSFIGLGLGSQFHSNLAHLFSPAVVELMDWHLAPPQIGSQQR